MSKFARQRSVKITFLDLQESQLKNVNNLLTKHGVATLYIEGIQRKSKTACEVTFKSRAILQQASPALLGDNTVEVETFGSGVTVITARRIPWSGMIIKLDSGYRSMEPYSIPRGCHRCGSTEHFVAQCKVKKCAKCWEEGHMASECSNQMKCSFCLGTGHAARTCPVSYTNAVKMNTTWS
ncbi:ZCCHC3 [Branchiostoma lanceolatum]|uniref:ZCCHC3 protein n=1 Tax=Branchiostoma lanceolatum TaxID=7740 RepID=A0A8J9VD42_BRALA|nr:ZCCHC3 [Branchiostoma lanceolatum]